MEKFTVKELFGPIFKRIFLCYRTEDFQNDFYVPFGGEEISIPKELPLPVRKVLEDDIGDKDLEFFEITLREFCLLVYNSFLITKTATVEEVYIAYVCHKDQLFIVYLMWDTVPGTDNTVWIFDLCEYNSVLHPAGAVIISYPRDAK